MPEQVRVLGHSHAMALSVAGAECLGAAMKPTIALAAAAFAHAMLIGLLTGLSMSPIVGVLLPLLLGAGGYRLVDSITGSSTPDTNGILMRVPSGVGWMVALWCAVVVASVFTGIGLRARA